MTEEERFVEALRQIHKTACEDEPRDENAIFIAGKMADDEEFRNSLMQVIITACVVDPDLLPIIASAVRLTTVNAILDVLRRGGKKT